MRPSHPVRHLTNLVKPRHALDLGPDGIGPSSAGDGDVTNTECSQLLIDAHFERPRDPRRLHRLERMMESWQRAASRSEAVSARAA
jgi:hypothetical protein